MRVVTRPFKTFLFILFLFVMTISAKIIAGELYTIIKEAHISDKQISLFVLPFDELSKVGIWSRPRELYIISDRALCRRRVKPL